MFWNSGVEDHGGVLMPAIVSHYLLAQRVYEALCELRPGLNLNHSAFVWGASGPDLFFCHRLLPCQPGRSLRSFGTRMHHAPADRMLNYLIGYALCERDDLVMSYALGFITHYAVDATAHPFVLYFSNVLSYLQPRKHPSVCHNELEAALDSIFLRMEQQGRHISSFPLQSAAPLEENVNRAIARVLQGYLLFEFGFCAAASEIVRAQQDWHHALKALYDPTGIKFHLIRRGEQLLGLPPLLSPMLRRDVPDLSNDPANFHRAQWFDPSTGKERRDTFPELTDQAEALSVSLIAQVLSGQKLTPEQCRASFSGK